MKVERFDQAKAYGGANGAAGWTCYAFKDLMRTTRRFGHELGSVVISTHATPRTARAFHAILTGSKGIAAATESRNNKTAALHYVCGLDGHRQRRLSIRSDARQVETLFIGPSRIERDRETSGERWHITGRALHIMEDGDMVCTVIRTPDAPPQLRYHLLDHLGSSIGEVGSDGEILSGETYFPFGGTAAATDDDRKMRRFSGKERDEATSLYDFGHRSYARSSHGASCGLIFLATLITA